MKKIMESWKIFVEEEKAWEAEDPEEENYSGRYEPPWMNTKIEDAIKVVLSDSGLMKDTYELTHSSNLSYEEVPDLETAKDYIYDLGTYREAFVRSPRDAIRAVTEVITHLYHNNELTLDFSEDNYKAMDDLYSLSSPEGEIRYETTPEILSQFQGINKFLDKKMNQDRY